jgi:ferredoxin
MRVHIDEVRCEGTGFCARLVPDLFALPDDVAQVLLADVPADLEGLAREAVNMCPASAIVIDD